MMTCSISLLEHCDIWICVGRSLIEPSSGIVNRGLGVESHVEECARSGWKFGRKCGCSNVILEQRGGRVE